MSVLIFGTMVLSLSIIAGLLLSVDDRWTDEEKKEDEEK